MRVLFIYNNVIRAVAIDRADVNAYDVQNGVYIVDLYGKGVKVAVHGSASDCVGMVRELTCNGFFDLSNTQLDVIRFDVYNY